MKRTWLKTVAMLLAFALVAAACGDDDASESTGDTTSVDDSSSDDSADDSSSDDSTEAAAGFEAGSPECVAPSDAGGWDIMCRWRDPGLPEPVQSRARATLLPRVVLSQPCPRIPRSGRSRRTHRSSADLEL